MSSDWTSLTTIQVKNERRDQLEQLQFKLQAQEGRRIDLRDVADRALEVGLTVLGMTAIASKDGASSGKPF